MFSENIQRALLFATEAHGGQMRKYTEEPYVVHLIEVMMIVRRRGGDEEQLIASLLHDTDEDTDRTIADIQNHFGSGVACLVEEVTDVYTDKSENRATRKKKEAERLWGISPRGQTIKYADLISNTKSIVELAPGFAETYIPEKEYILQGMRDGNALLYWEAQLLVKEAKITLNLT